MRKLSNFFQHIFIVLLLYAGLSIQTQAAIPITGSFEDANWTIYTARDQINTLFITPDRLNVWMGSAGGLEQRDISGERLFRLYTKQKKGLAINEISYIADDCKNGMWVGTPAGIFRINDKGVVSSFAQIGVYPGNSLAPDCQDGLWFTDNSSLLHLAGVEALGLPLAVDEPVYIAHGYDKETTELQTNDIRGIVDDNTGGLYIATGKGLYWWKKANETTYSDPTLAEDSNSWVIRNELNSSLKSSDIRSIISDGRGGLWIETPNHIAHLKRQDETFNNFEVFDKSSIGIAIKQILGGDENELLWLMSTNNQVYHNVNGEWQVFSSESGLPDNQVWALASEGLDKTLVWTGDGSLSRLSDGSWQTLAKLKQGLALGGNEFYDFMYDDIGQLWVGSSTGVSMLSKRGNWTRYQQGPTPLASNMAFSLENDGQGGVWVAGGGLSHLHSDGRWITSSMQDFFLSELPDPDLRALLSDENGGLWIGSVNKGLIHLEKNGNWTTYNTANVPTLQQNHIEKLISDGQGGLWLGTINGLYHAPALGAGISTDWTRYGTENSGLPDPWVFELLRDDKNGLWIGTNLGLAYFNPANNQWITNDEIASFPTAKIDALALDSHVPGHIWVSVDGAGLYTVHNSGANAFQPVLHTEITGTATIMDMISDGHGGLWLGIRGIGLRHLKKESGNWVFEAEEGFVQDLQARVIVPDWQPTGTAADLANLTEAERASIPVDNFGNPATLNGYWLGTKAEFGHIDLISRDALGNPTTVGLLDEFGHLTTSASVFEKIYPAIEYSDSALTQAVAATVPFHVNTAISDGEGGVYIGSNDGLMHLDKNRNVLPVSNNITDPVTTLLLLENKTLFVGTSEGLYLRKLDGGWVFFNTNNSNLLSNDILSLFVDEANTVWVWSRAGHVSYTTDYARWTSQGVIPSLIRAVVPDNTGGFWVSSEQGLDHVKNVQSALEVESFNEGLPNSDVRALISDTVGGLYIATSGGLAHLNFSEQADLIQRISAGSASDNESLIEELSSGERAAILIQPRGQGEGYQQEVSISFMASYAYKTLRSRGFKHSDIYFLTYEPGVDINGDGMQDRNAVDGPVTFKQFANGTDPRDLTIDDVRTAFAWAKDKGGLTQPLTVIFVDHGDAEQLLLDPFEERLTGGEFSSILDDYQQTTGNQAVVFIEACYSGTLIDELAGDKRIVITSTDDKRAYYDNLGSLSFSRLYFDQLRRGEDFFNAFETVRRKLPDLGYPFNQQMPQLDDNGDGASNSGRDGNVASQFCLNGCFGGLAGEITLLPNTQNQSLNSQEPITLSVKAGITDGKINRIWALVMTPEAAASRNAQGFALQPTPVVSLAKTDAGNWEGVFDDFKYRGDYIVTFMAEDQDGFVNSAAPITITQLAGDDFQTGDKAIAEKPVYREGEQLQITLPPLPEGQKQYVALNAPGFAELFILNNLNSLLIFDGITLPNWGGSNTVIELPINEFIPRGDYAVYLLRMDVGLDPLINFAQGGLGILQFRVE